MKIVKSILDAVIRHCPPVPPETGGMIGGHGDVMTNVVFDPCSQILEQAVYRPDIIFLNEQIVQWSRRRIEFRGMFHSHPNDQYDLSSSDRDYIVQVMHVMPENYGELYFPIVIPQKTMYVYRAKKNGFQVLIQEDALKIL